MNKNLIIGIITAGLILGGAFMVGASQNDENNKAGVEQSKVDTVALSSEKDTLVQEEELEKNGSNQQQGAEKQVDQTVTDTQQIELPITKEKAIEIAEKQTGGKVIEVELDRDDHRYKYELELIEERVAEIEMEIDAETGKIIELEYEEVDYYDDRY